jgi:hypothetical protein
LKRDRQRVHVYGDLMLDTEPPEPDERQLFEVTFPDDALVEGNLECQDHRHSAELKVRSRLGRMEVHLDSLHFLVHHHSYVVILLSV